MVQDRTVKAHHIAQLQLTFRLPGELTHKKAVERTIGYRAVILNISKEACLYLSVIGEGENFMYN